MSAPQSNLSSWTIGNNITQFAPVRQLYGVSDRDNPKLPKFFRHCSAVALMSTATV